MCSALGTVVNTLGRTLVKALILKGNCFHKRVRVSTSLYLRLCSLSVFFSLSLSLSLSTHGLCTYTISTCVKVSRITAKLYNFIDLISREFFININAQAIKDCEELHRRLGIRNYIRPSFRSSRVYTYTVPWR